MYDLNITINGMKMTILTALYFLCNLRMGPISWFVTLHLDQKPCQEKHFSLLGPFASNKENEVL
jgi:hypothetical protein